MALYFLKLVVYLLKTYRILAIWAPVSPSRTIASLPGLMGTKNVLVESVASTAGEKLKWRRPKVMQPKLEWTDAAFEFSFR